MGAEQRAVHRLAEQIALTEAAAGLAQEVSLRRRFDTLGDDRGTVDGSVSAVNAAITAARR